MKDEERVELIQCGRTFRRNANVFMKAAEMSDNEGVKWANEMIAKSFKNLGDFMIVRGSSNKPKYDKYLDVIH